MFNKNSFGKEKSVSRTFFVTQILILLVIQWPRLTGGFCNNMILFQFGIKAWCEREDGFSISCLNNPVKVHIQCKSGYYNDRNISLQTINCMENGKWSEQPIECKPECLNSPLEISKLLQIGEIKFPTSYVELEVQGIDNVFDAIYPNKFSGHIIYERLILTECNLKGTLFLQFKVRIPKPDSSWELYEINSGGIRRFTINETEFCYLTLDYDDSIKFDNNTKPNCLRFEFEKNNFLMLDLDKIHPEYKFKCYPPTFKDNSEGVEVLCYDFVFEAAYETSAALDGFEFIGKINIPVDCTNGADAIILRCRLGYQNKKSKTNSFLNKCKTSYWTYESHDSKDCESICGEANTVYEPDSIPLLYRSSPIDIIAAPWHVGIYANNTGESHFKQICGGTLIHSNIVISAAHCFYNLAAGEKYPTSNYLVGAGKKYRRYEADERFQHFAGLKEIHTPVNYQSEPVRNDIAILLLDHHIEYNTHIKPICIEWLPYKYFHVWNGIVGRISGWGSISADEGSSEELQTIKLLTVTQAKCKQMVNPNHRSEITGDKFCAVNEKNATACRGDSGGGFAIKKRYKYGGKYLIKNFLLGVVSTGIDFTKYCSNGFITTLTNIQFFQDFLKTVIIASRENECEICK